MAYNKPLPTDVNNILFEGVYDPAGHQFVAMQAGAVATDSAGNASAPLTVAPTNVPKSGVIGFTNPPAQTSAALDTAITFSATVNHWVLQNNTTAVVNFDMDTQASAGSLVLAPNATFFSDIPMTALHLFTAAAQNINGTAAGNIVLRGWL